MTRRQLHLDAVRHVSAKLAEMRVPVKATGMTAGLDLATPTHTIAVRGARLSRIIRYIEGVRYEYPGVRWNLHQHGVRRTAPDVWVLIVADGRDWPCYIVPGHELAGRLTVEATMGQPATGRGRPRNGTIRPYLNAWGELRRRRVAA